jgi:hypothetical protein
VVAIRETDPADEESVKNSRVSARQSEGIDSDDDFDDFYCPPKNSLCLVERGVEEVQADSFQKSKSFKNVEDFSQIRPNSSSVYEIKVLSP